MMENVDQEDWAFGGDGEEISDLIIVGDNFVVPTEAENEEGVDFYIFQCQTPCPTPHIHVFHVYITL
jgi:hypothetical protein